MDKDYYEEINNKGLCDREERPFRTGVGTPPKFGPGTRWRFPLALIIKAGAAELTGPARFAPAQLRVFKFSLVSTLINGDDRSALPPCSRPKNTTVAG
jgi:hypothetical protein